MKSLITSLLLLCISILSFGQAERWQQHAEYDMNIDMDVKKHQYKGTQKITYFNNSPEVLNKVFYHLYFNAFQPNSMMDMRNQQLPDSDARVKGRIQKLNADEIGFIKVKSLKHNGKAVKFETVGTILEVTLNEAIPANSKATFEMEWDAQVPAQIRRSGRMNKEGIDYSMTQWYPKMCEYDYQGWHANPYIGREFYGIWGDFDVKITIDAKYTLGASGYLQNATEIQHGYDGKAFTKPKAKKLTWHFKAPNVHDFAWAADPEYIHTTAQVPNGPTLHFIYKDNEQTKEWKELPESAVKAFEYISKHHGQYPYDQYTVIQGGDGGMEYPMITLITGHRKKLSLIGVTVHEAFHMWYQMMMGTNEALHAWMDEGFTSYGSANTMKHLFDADSERNPHAGSYQGYLSIANSGAEEALSTHADHFSTNRAYGIASYTKGAVFLHQLEYIVGKEVLAQILLDYFDTWKFKHPNPNDFIRVAEKAAGLELDWYKEYWVNTTHTIDYAVKSVKTKGKRKKTKATITLERVGKMPMPIEVKVTYKDGSEEWFYMPLQIMRGEKEFKDRKVTTLEDWAWTHPTYEFDIQLGKKKEIAEIVIDPSKRMADINKDNNTFKAE